MGYRYVTPVTLSGDSKRDLDFRCETTMTLVPVPETNNGKVRWVPDVGSCHGWWVGVAGLWVPITKTQELWRDYTVSTKRTYVEKTRTLSKG